MRRAELKGRYDFVALAAEGDAVSVERALFDWHFDDLLLRDDLLALTALALAALADDLSFSPAGVASLLDLLVHSWAHLEHLC